MTYLLPLAIMCIGASVFLWRLRFVRATPRAVRADRAQLPVSIIVPARNEATNLPPLLKSLNALQPAPKEIIVVDDHSSDGTGDIARSHGATVVVPEPMPKDWLGKSWACHSGAQVASGEYLLFTDADTVHAADSLAVVVDALDRRGGGLLSVVPTHIIEAGWERLQGIYQLMLLIATCAASGIRGADGLGSRRFAIGQYLLFTREAYDGMGGHHTVRSRLSEDLALGEAVADAGLPVNVLHHRGLLNVRMYPEGFASFVAGWRRSFRDGVGTAGLLGVLEIVMVMGWLLGLPVWTVEALFTGQFVLAFVWVAAYFASAAVVAWHQEGIGPFDHWTALTYPVFLATFCFVAFASVYDALRGTPVRWRGREIQLAR